MLDELQNRIVESGLLLKLALFKHAAGVAALCLVRKTINFWLFGCIAAVIIVYSFINFAVFGIAHENKNVLAAIFMIFAVGGAWLFIYPTPYLTKPTTKTEWLIIFAASIVCSTIILLSYSLLREQTSFSAGFAVTLILAAIYEETVYRYAIPNVISSLLKTKSSIMGVIAPFVVSSVLFVLMHDYSSYAWLALASVIFSFFAYRFGLAYAILAHMLWNTLFGVY